MNRAHAYILEYFQYDQLKDKEREIAFHFCDLAQHMTKLCEESKDSAEVIKGLGKLLDAKVYFLGW